MKTYTGHRTCNNVCYVMVIGDDGKRSQLHCRLDLFNHSPTGFEWGYGGSGPAQLALAILANLLDDDAAAMRLHQPFKWRVIAKLRRDRDWQLDEAAVRREVADIIASEKSIGAL